MKEPVCQAEAMKKGPGVGKAEDTSVVLLMGVKDCCLLWQS